MDRWKSAAFSLGFFLFLAAAFSSGCELIAGVDRDLIPSTGGSGATGGEGGAPTTGGGGSAECDTADDCGVDSDCASFSCDAGMCEQSNVTLGTTCDDDGGEVCDGDGNCVPPNCIDTVLNGNETDVDCGGDCPPCADGDNCIGGDDCVSGFCDDGAGGSGGSDGGGGAAPSSICAACVVDDDCNGTGSFYCSNGVCEPEGLLGDACVNSNQCQSGNCSDDVCCDAACAGGCDACSVAAGSSADGSCEVLPLGDAGNPSCAPYLCDGTDALCPTTCADNNDCITNVSCSDNLCCDTACTGTCESCSLSGTEGTCTAIPANQDPDNECTDGACNGSGACASDDGQSCTLNSDCLSNFCVDGVCCDNACAGNCEACDLTGTEGSCTLVASGQDPDNECANGSCDGGGLCKLANGVACGVGSDCLSTFCADGLCCDNGCGGTCEACDLGGSEGTCTLISGADPDDECAGADVCNGASQCQCLDGNQNGAETDTDCGGGVCPGCMVNDSCLVGSDCQSGVCLGLICQPTLCGDGVVNGSESCDFADPTTPCCNATCDGTATGGTVCGNDPDGLDCQAAPQCDGNDVAVANCIAVDEADDTPCIDDGAFCSGDETCQTGVCTSAGDPCAVNEACNEGTDTCDCVPDCTGKDCGDDGCGVSCGSCLTAGELCISFACAAGDPWINEFHYDNTGTDAGEFIEVAVPAGMDVSTLSVLLYNGSNGTVYGTHALTSFTQGTTVNGVTFYSITLPVNGLQNDVEGLALVDGVTVLEFLSYEGSFMATDGPASGMTSTDILVSEGSATPVGASLGLIGAGSVGGDFTWAVIADDTPGDVNVGQSML